MGPRGMRTIVLRGKQHLGAPTPASAGEWARQEEQEEEGEEEEGERGKDVNNSRGMQLLFSPLLQPERMRTALGISSNFLLGRFSLKLNGKIHQSCDRHTTDD